MSLLFYNIISLNNDFKMNSLFKKCLNHQVVISFLMLFFSCLFIFSNSASALSVPISGFATTTYQCGSGSDAIPTSINFGCYGNACVNSSQGTYCSTSHSALLDLLFAIIRFITDGVGLVIIGSLIVAGIQYSISKGDPKGLEKALERIKSLFIALLLFVFAYGILNFVVPSGLFNK